MNQRNASMIVIDADSYGTTLAITLARSGYKVILWGHDPGHIVTLERGRYSAVFLPDVPLPDTLHLGSDLAIALTTSRNILAVISSHVLGEVLRQIGSLVRPDTRLVRAAKRLEVKIGRLLQDVVRGILGDQISLVVIFDPTFVKELAAGLPTVISLASADQAFADDLRQLLHRGKSFHVYSNPDFIGVQPGGIVKNVITIDVGVFDGIGFGANVRTALTAHGLAEMSRLGAALDTDPVTSIGIARLGNLVFTCTDNQSRSRRFGMVLGQGMDVQSAQGKIGQVMEGYRNTKEVRELAHRLGVEMPIIEETYQALYCEKNTREAALALLGRTRKDECSSH